MPLMDGFEMSAEIHSLMRKMRIPRERQSTIYAVTAMNDYQIKDKHQKYGIKQVLSKPVRIIDLEPIMKEMINR